ncbi:MAG: RluA family pseudouridine synthase [Burkholderiaceae bacterium]
MAMHEQGEEQTVWLDAANGAGERLDRFLAMQLPTYSRSRLQRWIALGAVSCESRALTAKSRLTGQELIRVQPQPLEADQAFAPEPVDVPLVHEDEALLVVNKPAGLVVHPAPGNWQGTLMNGLLFHFESQRVLPRAGIVHRLDKDTTGLMVVARTEAFRESLVSQLSARTIRRLYLAVCHGHPQAFYADGSIGRDAANRLRMAVRADGKAAGTFCVPLLSGQIDGRPVSLVRCQLETGRTHQIRIHLADAGFPLVGDSLYGGQTLAGFGRQALHAFALGLVHPGNGQLVQWLADLPDDFKSLLGSAGWPVPGIDALTGESPVAKPR